ncbi:MAG: hypothetical protein ACYC9Y_13830 [Candidatus Methylomirabilia bacterium]
MSESDRPLPTPPRSRFGRDSREEAGAAPGMISDRMALAAAEGRLEEFLQHEIPEGEAARNLAMMMMGMSGMMPTESPPWPPPSVSPHSPAPPADEAQTAGAPEVPPGVLAAIELGDVAGLMGILRAEHAKRSPGAASGEAPQASAAPSAAGSSVPSPAPPAAQTGAGPAGIDAAIIEELIRISADNDVTVDWLMLRAVKLYVAEYLKTGRL